MPFLRQWSIISRLPHLAATTGLVSRPAERRCYFRGNGSAACSPLATTAGLSLAGFFFPLLQPMFRVGDQPAIRQQGFQGDPVTWGGGHIASEAFLATACLRRRGNSACNRHKGQQNPAIQIACQSRKKEDSLTFWRRPSRLPAEVGVTDARQVACHRSDGSFS